MKTNEYNTSYQQVREEITHNHINRCRILTKTLSKLRIQGNFINLITNIYQKTTPNTTLSCLTTRSEQVNIILEVFTSAMSIKRNKRYTDWKGRNKTTIFQRWHDFPQTILNHLPDNSLNKPLQQVCGIQNLYTKVKCLLICHQWITGIWD